jgi:hypothetical protein
MVFELRLSSEVFFSRKVLKFCFFINLIVFWRLNTLMKKIKDKRKPKHVDCQAKAFLFELVIELLQRKYNL